MNDSQFKLNPIVTMQHAYYLPPVGRSLWRKVLKDGALLGVKAKTHYPNRPVEWPQEKEWPADIALSLVQADLLRGKSIGFLPTKVHTPKAKESAERGWAENVELVIDEWILLEYACTFLPAQQNAIVEAVSKSAITVPEEILKALGLQGSLFESAAEPEPAVNQEQRAEQPILTRFTPLDEIERALEQRIRAIVVAGIAARAAETALDRKRGRV
jgi:hypothetical protein